jgi:hypothetical protein
MEVLGTHRANRANRLDRLDRLDQMLNPGLRRGQRKVLAGAGITIVVTVALLIASSGPRTPEQQAVTNNPVAKDQRALSIDHPATIQAGMPTNIVVRQTGSTRQVSLVVLGSAGSVTTQAIPVNGKAEFSLSSDATRLAGTVSLFARAGNRVSSATMVIKPGPMSNIVDPIVGPRSIITDGIDLTMAVAFPMDVLGNVAENGTPVDFTFDHPDGSTTRKVSTVKGLLAWREFNAHFEAGNAQASTRSSGQFGRSYTLRETPSIPEAFTLNGSKLLPAADGFTLVQVFTSPLKDIHGNLFDDGTAVIFTWDGPEGRSRQTSKTLAGVAELVFEAPSSPSTVTFTAWALGTTSSPLELKFQPATANIAVRLERSDHLLTARIGPVIGDHDAYVKDGTRAQVTFTGAEGGRIVRSVELVSASAIIREPTTGLRGAIDVRVSVLGYDRVVRLLPNESLVDTGGVGRNDKVVEAGRTDILRSTATDTTVPQIPVIGSVDAGGNG